MTDTTNVDPAAGAQGAAGSGAAGGTGTPPAQGTPAADTQTPPAGQTPPPANTEQPKADAQTPPVDVKDPATPDPKAADAAAFKIPDEYKDKPWASKVKTLDDLWKQLDNTQTLVGKKTIVPDLTKATDAEREEYFAQTRPKDVAEYVFADTAQGPVDPAIKTAMGDILMKNGVSAFQANNIIKGYQEAENALLTQQFSPDGMKSALETAFGADWEKVTGHTRRMINGLMSPDDQKALDHLPNTYLATIYRTLGNVVKAYGVKETDAHVLMDKGGPAPANIDSVRQGLRDQLSKMSMQPHTAEQKAALTAKLAETYKTDPRIQQG